MANLDLRTRETALRGGKHGPAVVPGDAAASHMYRHLIGQEKPQMPFGGRLTDAEIALVKEWIESGAEWDADYRFNGHREEIHRTADEVLGLSKSSEAGRARAERRKVGAQSDRRFRPGQARRKEAEAESARRQESR